MKTFFLLPLAALCLFSASHAQINPANGLLAYYPFNGNANDQSGSNRDGNVYGSILPAKDRFGNSNSAYFFSGGYILTNVPYDIEDDFTVNFWFKTEDTLYQRFFSWYENTDSKWVGGFTNHSNNQIGGYYGEDDQYGGYASYGCLNQNWQQAYYSDGQWHMFTLLNSGKELFLYVDATILNAVPMPYIGIAPGIQTTNFLLSTSDPLSDFHGSIDDVMVYGRALSANEISYIHTLPHSWVSPLAAEDPDKPAFCEIHPNPSRDITHLSFANPKSYNLRVLDNMNREVARQTTHGLNHDLNTSEWPEGLYYVQVQDASGKTQTLRFVKK